MFVFVKLEDPIGSSMGPNFELVANVGTVVPNTFTAAQLIEGVLVEVDNSATLITVNSGNPCNRYLNMRIIDVVNFF